MLETLLNKKLMYLFENLKFKTDLSVKEFNVHLDECLKISVDKYLSELDKGLQDMLHVHASVLYIYRFCFLYLLVFTAIFLMLSDNPQIVFLIPSAVIGIIYFVTWLIKHIFERKMSFTIGMLTQNKELLEQTRIELLNGKS